MERVRHYCPNCGKDLEEYALRCEITEDYVYCSCTKCGFKWEFQVIFSEPKIKFKIRSMEEKEWEEIRKEEGK